MKQAAVLFALLVLLVTVGILFEDTIPRRVIKPVILGVEGVLVGTLLTTIIQKIARWVRRRRAAEP